MRNMQNITHWNPVREMITLREALEHLVNDNYGHNQDYRRQSVAWQLPIDAYADDEAIVITADVPGLKPEELQVTMESNTLTIRGELKNRPEGRNYLLSERATSHFERVLTINTPIDSDRVEAAFENGVLLLTLPKAEANKPKQIAINAIHSKN
jgi:HSP20 family protein